MTESWTLDWTALFLLLFFSAAFFFLFRRKNQEKPKTYPFPSLSPFKKMDSTFRTKWFRLPRTLKLLSLCFFGAAFIDPRVVGSIEDPAPKRPLPTEGIALFLVLDRSGSMGVPMLDERENALEYKTKLEILKTLSSDFVKRRSQDLIGLVSFARVPQILSPLTLEHRSIQERLQDLSIVKKKMNDGTAIGYAIYKTASIIAATKQFEQQGYEIEGSAIILVTDGFQNPHVDDEGDPYRAIGIEEAARYAKEQGVKLYLVSIDPMINDPKFAPQRRLMKRSSKLTGGDLFTAQAPSDLRAIYQSIDKLEKSRVPSAQTVQATILSQPLRLNSYAIPMILIGMTVFLAAVALETLFIRKVP